VREDILVHCLLVFAVVPSALLRPGAPDGKETSGALMKRLGNRHAREPKGQAFMSSACKYGATDTQPHQGTRCRLLILQ